MGIQGLSKLLADHAPGCMKEGVMKNYFGRKIAIDASMSLYQFLIAVRSEGSVLQNDAGETTSHLMGFFYRTIRMIENGLKPVYVFDGKPPQLKSGELEKRTEKRAEAEKGLKEAEEAGNADDIERFNKRLVKVTRQHNDDVKKLLKLMGVPFVEAPCEAEAQCAELCKSGKVFATATEDMDALTFASPVLLRHLTFSEARKLPIKEFSIAKALAELDLTMDSFIDLCILLGCDYCDSIKGIGPAKAIDFIRKYKNIETVLEHIDRTKFKVPENWPFAAARLLFKEAEVTPSDDVKLKWTDVDLEPLIQFMCKEKGFQEDRIRAGAAKLSKSFNTKPQGRLDSFFKVLPSANPPKKRPADAQATKGAAKKGKGAAKSTKPRR